jgi:hypothetical protein
MGVSQKPVSGPNDFNLASGALQVGLGDEVEADIRARRGMVAYEEPPAKAELRKQATELASKAKQLSAVERELEKERDAMRKEHDDRLALLAEREAMVAASLKALEG